LAEESRDVYYATGHRKDATAKVWLTPGTGIININKMPSADYLKRKALDVLIRRPLDLVEMAGKVDVDARVLGGGTSGQAGAIKHGIAKALVAMNPDLRPPLRRIGYLTRDPRVKERKKYGRKRARRAFQFTKR
jgi:small subunit ribosomal protein S9